MKILHYSLGTPPYRSGGLTKYSIDLMKTQIELNNEVFLIYPGAMELFHRCRIQEVKEYDNIRVFELKNPLPVPLVQGVKNPDKFYASRDLQYFKNWLEKLCPDIVHIHTFMGLPIEFLKACKLCNIKIVFTTHDYFGICPKVNLVRSNSEICNSNRDYDQCIECCRNGYSMKLIYLLQSNIYKTLKEKGVTSSGWKTMKNTYTSISKLKNTRDENKNYVKEQQYEKLREYYEEMFKYVDFMHFNSSVSKGVYTKFLGGLNGEVINITHKSICDNRRKKIYAEGEPLRISFLGSDERHKGLYMLIAALGKLSHGKESFELNIYGVNSESPEDNIVYRGRYTYDKLKEIFEKSDVVIVPSIWYETYGFVALEAYSYGVPVILTELVGFKDLIQDGVNGLVCAPESEALKERIEEVIFNRKVLSKINENILKDDFSIFHMKNHCRQILDIYCRLLKI